MNNVSDLLLKKGEEFYNVGRTLLKVLGISIVSLTLIYLIALIGWGSKGILSVLTFTSYTFVNFLTIVSYLGILIGLGGISSYHLGLHYMGLGQIAKNTKNLIVNREASSDELPEL